MEVADQRQAAQLARPGAVAQLQGGMGQGDAAVGAAQGVENDLVVTGPPLVVEPGDTAEAVGIVQRVEIGQADRLAGLGWPDPGAAVANAPTDAVVRRRS